MAKRMMVLVFTLLAFSQVVAAAEEHYLYKAKLVQAAPGKLLELIDLYKSAAGEAGGDQPPLWIRHSQGDRWDLLILFPMESYAEYYRPERVARRDKAASADLAERFRQDIAWQEDVFVYGPPLDEVKKAFAESALFHVEMFQSLPGKQAQLYHEREMENAFSHALKEPENLIFVRDQGAAWDLFTIGCFRNLRHYAESEAVSAADRDAAAKAAGFTDAGQIGPFLRTFIG